MSEILKKRVVHAQTLDYCKLKIYMTQRDQNDENSDFGVSNELFTFMYADIDTYSDEDGFGTLYVWNSAVLDE